MMNKLKTTAIATFLLLALTSCLKEPKEKKEQVVTGHDFEKVLDEVVGVGSINPSQLTVGQKDTRVETVTISNAQERELSRRRMTLDSATCIQTETGTNNCTGAQFVFNSEYIGRDENGAPQDPVTFARTTKIIINPEGYYEFEDDGTEKTIHSWDLIIGLRGMCHSFFQDPYQVDVACSDIRRTDGSWSAPQVPAINVKVLSFIRQLKITNTKTGESYSNKLRYTVKYAPEVQEISKIVSYCSEGLQQFENQIYYLVRCNNLESL